MSRMCKAVLAMACTLALVASASETMDGVTKLTAKGVSEDVILAWAKTRPDFEATAANIVALKDAKVSDTVILALINAATPVPAAPEAPQVMRRDGGGNLVYTPPAAPAARPAPESYQPPPVTYAQPAAETYVAPPAVTYAAPAYASPYSYYPYSYPYGYYPYYPYYGYYPGFGLGLSFGFGRGGFGYGGFGRGGFGHGGFGHGGFGRR